MPRKFVVDDEEDSAMALLDGRYMPCADGVYFHACVLRSTEGDDEETDHCFVYGCLVFESSEAPDPLRIDAQMAKSHRDFNMDYNLADNNKFMQAIKEAVEFFGGTVKFAYEDNLPEERPLDWIPFDIGGVHIHRADLLEKIAEKIKM